MPSFKIYNLEGNQMYFKNIGPILHIFQTKRRKKNLSKKKILPKLLFYFKQDHKVIQSTPKFNQF